jgi:hypothetical protein
VDGQNSLVGTRITEVKRRLDGTEARYACEPILVEPGRRAVIRYVLDRPGRVPGVDLRAGMETYGHFWIDRRYNAYHWLDGERTVGVYFNIGVCDEISAERVGWTDYIVDVLATPDGAVRVLDEDEVSETTPPAVRDVIARARANLLAGTRRAVAEVESETRRLRR